ncbi:MAG: hypothetical protein ACXVP5_00680 [Tumebacillaceae bacterium]
MKKRIFALMTTAMLVLGLFLIGGCGSSSPSGQETRQPVGAKADLELDVSKSVYPYLVLYNQGSVKAEDVHVLAGKSASGQELTPLGLLRKSGNNVTMSQVTKPLNLETGQGAQVQLLDKDLRDYVVQWKEGGQVFSKQLVLPQQQKIETH